MNLLQETLEALNENGYTLADVEFIGSSDGKYAITPKHFMVIADEDYNSGFGAAVVAGDLVIVMQDGSWFDREEYDGSEWWVFNKKPVLSESPIANAHQRLIGGMWEDMEFMLGDKE